VSAGRVACEAETPDFLPRKSKCEDWEEAADPTGLVKEFRLTLEKLKRGGAMLVSDQAMGVVAASIQQTTGAPLVGAVTLADAGIVSDTLNSALLQTITSDPNIGVAQYKHFLEASLLDDVNPQMEIATLADMVYRLASRKLCSGVPGHEQPFPYPPRCQICRSLVI
jgi:hypothetical protein